MGGGALNIGFQAATGLAADSPAGDDGIGEALAWSTTNLPRAVQARRAGIC